jgi:phosphoribosylpyrophosphate synthetase
LIKLIKELNALGAASVSIVITHGMFNKDAIEKLQVLKNNGMFDKIYVTNSVYRDESFYPDRVEVIDCSPNFADPIASIVEGKKINYNLPLTPLAA